MTGFPLDLERGGPLVTYNASKGTRFVPCWYRTSVAVETTKINSILGNRVLKGIVAVSMPVKRIMYLRGISTDTSLVNTPRTGYECRRVS